MPVKTTATLFYRKPRSSGNFSIESAFDQIMASFPANSPWKLRKFVSSYFSNGVVPRTKAILEARRNQDQVNHVTGDVNYLALGLPRDRTVLTIHDCGMIDRVKNPAKRLFLKWFWLDLPVRRATIVTADSIATRDDLIRLTACDPEKIRVVPVCISSAFVDAPFTFNKECPEILHVGTAYNKNLERHIRALAGLRCRLRIIGQITREHTDLLERHQIDYRADSNLTEDEIVRAYRSCDLVLFASTLEGFGMPVLEAQRTGRPVITSNLSSMPEIAGEGACLVDPFDVDSIRCGIDRIIEDDAYRQSLVEKGRHNLHRFQPTAIAKAYASIYESVLEAAQPHDTTASATGQRTAQAKSV